MNKLLLLLVPGALLLSCARPDHRKTMLYNHCKQDVTGALKRPDGVVFNDTLLMYDVFVYQGHSCARVNGQFKSQNFAGVMEVHDFRGSYQCTTNDTTDTNPANWKPLILEIDQDIAIDNRAK